MMPILSEAFSELSPEEGPWVPPPRQGWREAESGSGVPQITGGEKQVVWLSRGTRGEMQTNGKDP